MTAGRPEYGAFVRLLREVEEHLRWAVEEVLSSKFGEDWWRMRAAPLLRAGAEWKRANISDCRWVMTGSRAEIDNWPLFEPMFRQPRTVVNRALRRVNELRGEIVHPDTDWDSLRLERIEEVEKDARWIIQCVQALPGRQHYDEVGGVLKRLELAGLVQTRPIESGPAKFDLSPHAWELFVAALEEQAHECTETYTEDELMGAAVGSVLIGEFGTAEVDGTPTPVKLSMDILEPYVDVFLRFLYLDPERSEFLRDLIRKLRAPE